MENMKSMDLGAAQNKIAYANGSGEKVLNVDKPDITATIKLDTLKPTGDKVVVSIKSWPAQSAGGLFVPDSYTVIRGEKYIATVEEVGEETKFLSKGDTVVIPMYSGYLIPTTTRMAKIANETDILMYKKKEDMETPLSYHPDTFKPGMNYILVEVDIVKEVVTASGLIARAGEESPFSKNDAMVKTGVVRAVGPTNEWGKSFSNVKEGSKVIYDAYVGNVMNATTVEDEGRFVVMFAADVLSTIEE